MNKGLDAMAVMVSPEVWNLVNWIAFSFKLVSLAFAFPIASLLVFDFGLWIWRLSLSRTRDRLLPDSASQTFGQVQPQVVNATALDSQSTSIPAHGSSGTRRIGFTGK